MMRLSASLIATVMLLTGAPAHAQTLEKPECTKANIDSTDEKVGKMKDGKQKSTATAEIALARDNLAKGQTEECQNHLLKASVQTK